jgi:hypothetical protein
VTLAKKTEIAMTAGSVVLYWIFNLCSSTELNAGESQAQMLQGREALRFPALFVMAASG